MAFLGIKTENIKLFLSTKKTLVFIVLAILPLVYLSLIFYLYAFLNKTTVQEENKKIFIDQKLYERVMENFRQRELNFSEEANKIYTDPFGR